MAGLTIACADGDPQARRETRDALVDDGHDVVSCATVNEADNLIGTGDIDCVVTEYSLPDGTGLELTELVRDRSPDTPCVLFTDATPDRIDSARHGDVVVEYLPRDMPDARESLCRLVENVVAQRTQVGYPLPPDEDERLAALAQYDRPGMDATETFDRLTELARAHFGVDVAFVGVIDAHEERFLACAGEDWETLTREDSMCTHTILEDDMLVVEDVDTDPRFADNERLAELDITAYAGVPLRTPRGATIGAFCLTHSETRSFSEAELADLRRFADEAMEQLELRRRLDEANASPTGSDGDDTFLSSSGEPGRDGPPDPDTAPRTGPEAGTGPAVGQQDDSGGEEP
jgi:CheY-like chemotaxis protein